MSRKLVLAAWATTLLVVAGVGWAQGGQSPRGMDFGVYIRLEDGMSEAELLVRAGKPDRESLENLHGMIVKTYYYLPTASDPFITAITLRGGRIVARERTRQF